ncbi:hypothetical protein TNCV_5100201 [Trichonephila clavipes]|uniref:Transposase IS30-like HTH domain-containing protein n=1 Tax=Trichonephila clavipes TaxID=2585209 RepID=A0A8X6RW27_TRICX|nr:hypothetical protein TNCV_5100201 [Trichonephila clavipes]
MFFPLISEQSQTGRFSHTLAFSSQFVRHPAVKLKHPSRPPRRNKEKYQQLTEFERERIIDLREGGFSYRAIGARVQRNSSSLCEFGATSTEQLAVDDGRRRQRVTID